MRNLTLVNRAYCIRNPKHYKGFGPDCWGLTASYSTKGYAAHCPGDNGPWCHHTDSSLVQFSLHTGGTPCVH